jgi:hypothetical protein
MDQSTRARWPKCWGLAAAIIAMIILAGCQQGVGATATGVVSFNGKAAPAGILVRFQPQVPNSSASLGVTDATGRYELRFNARTPGVMPGESVVSLAIVSEPDATGKQIVPDALEGITIPPAYGDKSTLKKTVKPGANVIDIDIVP